MAGDQVARGGQVVRGVQGDDLGGAGALELPLDQAGEGAGRRQLDHAGDAEVGQGAHAEVPAHRGGDLADQALDHLAAVADGGAVEVGQQDPVRVGRGDAGGDRGQGGLGRRHVRGVERAGDLQRDHPGPGRRLGGELVQPVQARRRRRSGRRRCGWPGTARRRRSRRAPRRRRRRGRAAMPVGSSAQAAAISRPRTPARVIAASAGTTPASAAAPSSPTLCPAVSATSCMRQLLGGEQGGGDQQRLGPGGVLDLVRVGRRCRGGPGRPRPARTTSAAGPRRRAGRATG